MIEQLKSYLYDLIWPVVPPGQFFGYCWQPGVGVPANLTIFNGVAGEAGVYIGFKAATLDMDGDYFGRFTGRPGPVFTAPLAPSAAVTQIINQVNANPPEAEADYFSNVTTQRLQDITGFLAYMNTCLNIIYNTAAGAELLNRINAAGYPVVIIPTIAGGNQVVPSGGTARWQNALTQCLLDYAVNEPLEINLLNVIIQTQYANLEPGLDQYNQLAADLNAMPLYSLFAVTGQPGFLGQNFQFMNQAITGQNLMDWLSPAGSPAFNTNVLTFANNVQGVLVRQYFLLALIMLLYYNTPPPEEDIGAGAVIGMNVINEFSNQQGNADFRPPAIGLAHELTHAMYFGEGTNPGQIVQHFSTTASELLAVGLGPFAQASVSENAVRNQWNTIPAALIDASNIWANPQPRTIYDAPVPPETAQQLRAHSHSI